MEVKGGTKRTLRQNASLHKYCELLADALNSAGLDIKRTLRQDIDIPWTPATVKELIWRTVQQAQLGKKSTTRLTTSELSKVYETINRHLSTTHGVHVPFPSAEDTETKKG